MRGVGPYLLREGVWVDVVDRVLGEKPEGDTRRLLVIADGNHVRLTVIPHIEARHYLRSVATLQHQLRGVSRTNRSLCEHNSEKAKTNLRCRRDVNEMSTTGDVWDAHLTCLCSPCRLRVELRRSGALVEQDGKRSDGAGVHHLTAGCTQRGTSPSRQPAVQLARVSRPASTHTHRPALRRTADAVPE